MEYIKAVYCHPINLYAEYIMRNAGLEEAQAGIKIAGMLGASVRNSTRDKVMRQEL